MSTRTLLDLGEIDPAVWRLMIRGSVYGPYTLGQIRAFVEEGRIGAHSKISHDNPNEFARAESFYALADIIARKTPDTTEPTEPDEEEHDGRPERRGLATCNYLVIVQPAPVDDGEPIIEAMNACGHFTEAMPGIFVLRSDMRTGALRRRLSDAVGEIGQVVIVNASQNRLAWCNLSDAASDHLRRVWD